MTWSADRSAGAIVTAACDKLSNYGVSGSLYPLTKQVPSATRLAGARTIDDL